MSKSTKAIRDARRQQQKRRDQARSIGMIIIGVVLVLGAIVGLAYAGEQAINLIDPPLREHPQASMNSVGDPDAPIVVENYSSFKCSHCFNFFTESEELFIQNYVATGLVYYVYQPYHFDVSRIETQASHAALCAGEQGAFWEMHDILFANFTVNYTSSTIVSMADYFDLDMDAFEDCQASGKYYDQILGETQRVASELGISGTPTFVINGEVAIVGNEGYQALANAVDAALAELENE